MTRRSLALAVAAVSAGAAAPPPMHLMLAEPRPNQVVSGSGVAFALHFDKPLDHQAARFMLASPSGAERTVPVRLSAQPNVLYGSVGRLEPGPYALTWSARSSAGASLTGTIPFQVGPATTSGPASQK